MVQMAAAVVCWACCGGQGSSGQGGFACTARPPRYQATSISGVSL